MNIKISPSILGGSFSNIEKIILDLNDSKAEYIHFDVMDGDFVPNLTFGPKFISDVKSFSKGDNVTYASPPLGSYSDKRIIPEKIAVRIPEGISHKIAASIMTKGLTVFYLLCKTYKPIAGEIVLFHAAAGGVGQIFCQWAKSIGCKVIGTVGSEDKIEIAKKNGCDFVINYNKESFDKKVLEITNNKGIGVVYDGVGKNTFEKSINCLKPRGMMVSFGNSSGPLSPIDVKKYIAAKSLYFKGFQ